MKHLSTNKKKTVYIYTFSVLFAVLSVLLGVLLGSTRIGIADLFRALLSIDKSTPEAKIIFYVRLPRVLGALVCGAALAVSGAVIQNVLANRLASPSIIGVNSGAGLAVTVCSAVGMIGGWMQSLFAFVAAFLTVTLVSLGAKRWGASRGTVILMGVAINSLLGAISDTVITFMPDVSISYADFKVGDFSGVTYSKILPSAVLIAVALTALFTLCSELYVLTLGDGCALSLGMNVGRMRVVFLLLSALLAAAAVSVAGLLSFVGLLVPHAVRRIAGSRSALVLPLSAIIGAGFVTLCDTLARVVFAPYEIPVGIIMAFLGAPFFLFILIKRGGGEGND